MGFFHVDTNLSSYNLSICAAAVNNTLYRNLTSSYIQQLNDITTLSTSIIMFVLAALFFNLNLFSRFSDVSAILDPRVRVFLTSALSLFLPVMSYLFSEAKNESSGANSTDDQLHLRARLILIWMLLVELLRKKVEEISMQGYSGTMERVGRVLWLGSLVFLNLKGAGKRALLGILWFLCVTRLVQRIVFTEVGKRSFAYRKNARLITAYMAQVLEEDEQEHRFPRDGCELLKRCRYVVMEEENLVVQPMPGGYRLRVRTDGGGDTAATVGKIWGLADPESTDSLLSSLDRDQGLRRLCLSFALFKLLRRRFEHLPAMTPAETRSYRELIFKGIMLQSGKEGASASAKALFRLTHDELKFLSEYYHSVVPVVLASPFFLLANYLLLPLVVFVLCLVIIVICTNGDVPFAWESIMGDDSSYFTFFDVTTKLTGCLRSILISPIVFFSFIDFSITSLLFLMVVYEEAWEFFVLLLSDWFMVSLLCKYAVKPDSDWHHSHAFRWATRCISGMRRAMHRPDIRFNQLCVLRFCWLAMPTSLSLPVTLSVIPLPAMALPDQVKHSIIDYLARKLHDLDGNPTTLTLSKGMLALTLAGHEDLLPFCCEGITEVILTWHIATSLLEVKYPPTNAYDEAKSRLVGTNLSKYCAYLVAFHPELLPDNQDSTELLFQAMMQELRRVLGPWCFYFSPWCGNTRTRYNKIMGTVKDEDAEQQPSSEPAGTYLLEQPSSDPAGTYLLVQRGATLAHKLEKKALVDSSSGREGLWKLLANLWVELVVYIAPSSDDRCIEGHRNVLPKGGEFITVLWALATHAGISRPPDTTGAAVPIERVDVCV